MFLNTKNHNFLIRPCLSQIQPNLALLQILLLMFAELVLATVCVALDPTVGLCQAISPLLF